MENNWEDCAEEEEFDGEEEEAEAAVEEEGIDFLVTLSRFRVQEAQIKELKQQVNQLAAAVAELLKRSSQTT